MSQSTQSRTGVRRYIVFPGCVPSGVRLGRSSRFGGSSCPGVSWVWPAIQGAHKTVWFWGFWTVIVLMLAMAWRLRTVLKERDAARHGLAGENSRERVARRMEDFADEHELLMKEFPGHERDIGLGEARILWERGRAHLAEQIKSELRRNAPGFTSYWLASPDPMPPVEPFDGYAKAFSDLSVEQLRRIAAWLREGRDEPQI
jgi:hypothetical protein